MHEMRGDVQGELDRTHLRRGDGNTLLNSNGESLDDVHTRAIHSLNAFRGRLSACECAFCERLREEGASNSDE